MIKSKMTRIKKAFIYTVILVGVGLLIAFAITEISSLDMKNILFIEGLLVFLFGLILSMNGNPSGVNLQGLGMQNAQQISNWNLEITRVERDKTGYIKNFVKHSIVYFDIYNIVMVISGIIIALLGIVYF